MKVVLKASELIAILDTIKNQHGDVAIYSYPGFDSSYPVTKNTISFHEQSGVMPPHIFICADGFFDEDD